MPGGARRRANVASMASMVDLRIHRTACPACSCRAANDTQARRDARSCPSMRATDMGGMGGAPPEEPADEGPKIEEID